MNIEEVLQNGIKTIDLTNDSQAKLVIETANDLLKEYPKLSDLRNLENDLLEREDKQSTFLKLAVKLACSKNMVSQVKEPLHISVVFAVYKEHQRKGGSILYGMWNLAQKDHSQKHIVVFTDADLSTHLGQLMLLADPIINANKLAAIGSRREKQSVVVKKSARNNRGKLFIYLWKRMIPNLSNIIDTQCGFKAFRADIIPEITLNNVEHKFAFDVELLIKTTLLKENSICKVPIAWIDSDAASTTADLQPYLPMLKSIAKMQVQYFSSEEKHNDFVDFVNSLDEEKFSRLLDNIPQNIVSREPDSFADYAGVSVGDLQESLL